MQALALLVTVVAPWLLLEARRSWRHERALRERGAVEPVQDVHRYMQVAYPALFAAMAVEGMLRGPACALLVAAGIGVFLAGKLVKWWAILALGPFWSFRVLVVPGAPLVAAGPYRFVRHPNYVGVLGEIVGTALMMAAPIAGLVALVGFGLLLRARIAVEERALGLRAE